ncbi:PTS ascorbate transporter subunit IIB [Actinomadura sp. NBRC 104425]|uniref:PTS sugar transporter subunit IIB n=1 Tax=Actinomadura sp. NBRC 104425 TaxID=3032204 RepID=UPI0024A15444|nr:PTS sugar transporter subunit IIB [Actinomadura sp. NBRC 104425]GLZ12972.1 PTS ascorbate transporter subunit IIB [Actinomadura sp. NBRC 104425]
MKLLAVCGMGIGTSIILKTNAEKALQNLGVDGEVEVADIGTARGAAVTADVVLTSGELAAELGEVPAQVVVVDNFVDVDEITGKLSAAIQARG